MGTRVQPGDEDCLVKVRIGIGAGGVGLGEGGLDGLCSTMGEVGFDSIWIPEVLSQPGVDPLVALGWLAGRLPKLKIGTTFLVPGRNVLRLARQLATLDHLSEGRLLLTAVPGLPRGGERTAVGVELRERGTQMDEALPLLRSLLSGNPTDVPGPLGVTEGVVLDPIPRQQPLEIWLGGSLPSALDRCGRLSDGWLPAMITPAECAEGKRRIDEVAESVGRAIDPEHFGVSIGYAAAPLPDQMVKAIEARTKGTPIEALVPVGMEATREMLEAYIDVGFSKFVMRPLLPPEEWRRELETLADAVVSLQT